MSQVLTPEPLIAALPSLSPRLAAARDKMLSVLSRTIGDLTLKAAIAADASEGPWVVFQTASGQVGLAQVGEGARDHAEVLARLDRLEPLLAALETNGLSFDPIDVEAASETDIHVRVEAFDAELTLRHVAVLALDLDVAEAWPETAEAPSDLSRLAVPLSVALTLDGPTVPADSALDLGDIVLLPFGADRVLSATLAVGGHRARGLFSPARGGFSVNSLEPIPMSDFAASAAVEPSSPDPAVLAGDLPVTLRVALGEVTLTAAQLASLRPGATLSLDVPPAEARAVLLAGDRPVASGRLVALGEAYGLVIDKVGAEV
jgi:flagellar motor switch/type III secretory pathway protein FliN